MPGYQDLLSGFSERKAEVEQQNYDRSLESSAMEQKLFSHLLGSDDPEIQRLAMTGLLDSANPKQRKGGLRGWLGELEQSPHLAAMKALINTPVNVPNPVAGSHPDLQPGITQTLGSRQSAQGVAMQPGVQPSISEVPQSAGMAPTALTEQKGQAPPTPTSYTQAPPVPYTLQQPRQVFMNPIDKQMQTEEAQARGQVRGRVSGYIEAGGTREEGLALERARLQRTGGGLGISHIAIELPDGSQHMAVFDARRQQYIDPDTQTPFVNARPLQHTGNARFFGQDLESISHEPDFGGKPYAAQDSTTQARINAEKQRRETQQAGATTTARGQANADVPLTTQQRYQAINGMQDDWRKVEAPHREIQRQYDLMQTGLRRFNQGDKIGGSQAVLVTFQKILDPTSVVRESEYARTPEGLGLLERMRGSLERLTSGGAGVPAAELAAMVETGRQIVTGMATWNAAERQRIEATAQQFKIDPALITGRPTGGPPAPTTPGAQAAPTAAGGPPASVAAAPAVGDTVMYKGKRYKVAGVTNGQADLELIP